MLSKVFKLLECIRLVGVYCNPFTGYIVHAQEIRLMYEIVNFSIDSKNTIITRKPFGYHGDKNKWTDKT